MNTIKVWENRVSGCLETDDPEEAVAIESFNKHFAELFWFLPREKRYTFMKLIRDINTLYTNECIKDWQSGFKFGKEHGHEYKLPDNAKVE